MVSVPGWLRSLAGLGSGGGSKTAERVAAARATLDRPYTAGGDPNAQRRLARWMRPARSERLTNHLRARTMFFDRAVLDAIADGVKQVVIVGAGFDDRALRFRAPGVRFYELDHPATQADKRRRLKKIGADTEAAAFVGVDFRLGAVAEALAAAGHDGAQRSLFICEGLLVYLDRPAIVELLSALSTQASEGAVLVASLAVHRDGLDSRRVAEAANARRRLGRREPWVTILTRDTHLELLHEAGWWDRTVLDDHDVIADAVSGRSLLVCARTRDR